jgi:protein-S-isoprenylcysteine O-methyltransferase Ste14
MSQVAGREPVHRKPDTAGIRLPPPLYYIVGFLVGVALELAFPTSWPPAGVRIAVTALALAAWLLLDGAAMLNFRRAGTSMVPMNPTTALVTSGPTA